MDKMFYLLSVGVSGIKSIKKEVRLNFYKKTVDKDFDPDKYRIKAIYGENGSGKSALITAVNIFQELVINESYLAESKKQKYLEEMVNKSTHEFKFNCEYLINLKTEKLVYFYEFILGLNNRGDFEIQHEVLKVKNGNYPNNKYKTVFETSEGELIKVSCDEKDRALVEKKSLNLLSSRSFMHISTKMYMETEDVKAFGDTSLQIFLFLSLILQLKVYLGEEDQHEDDASRRYMEGVWTAGEMTPKGWKNYFSVNEKTIKRDRFEEYQKRVAQLAQFIKVFKPELVSIDIDKKENGDNYECDLVLKYGEYSINREFESTGIKKLIRLFDCVDADWIIKGVRSTADFEYEQKHALYNRSLDARAETLYMPADPAFDGISSTLARRRLKAGESAEGILPEAVIQWILAHPRA